MEPLELFNQVCQAVNHAHQIRDSMVIKKTSGASRERAEDQIERLKAERSELMVRLRDTPGELGGLAPETR